MSRSLKAAIFREEERIKDLPNENMVVLGENGVVRGRSEGTPLNVRPPQGVNLNNSIITHNHTGFDLLNSTGGGGMAAQVGRTMSYDDLKLAIDNNARAIRVTTPNYIFYLRRPHGTWGVSSDVVMAEYQRIMSGRLRARPLYLEQGGTAEENNIRRARAIVVERHRAIQELATMYGWYYARRRR